jgi:hypothetical protein
MHNDTDHHLTPLQRLELLRAFGLPSQHSPAVNRFRGWLGILTARYVLPIWHAALPIWTEIPQDLPDDNLLPDRLITLAETILAGTADLQAAWQEVNDHWYVVGNIGYEFTDRDDVPLAAYFACDAALRALYEALNTDFLDQIPVQADYTDETVPDEWRDSASSAVMAYAGGGKVEPVDLLKRRLFWEWWLQEAIPTAWARRTE